MTSTQSLHFPELMCKDEIMELVHVAISVCLCFRNPEAMKAATKEVQRMLENAGEKIDLKRKPISLNRKQLDNIPVLGTLALYVYKEIHKFTWTFHCFSVIMTYK